ncbi:hypothetical protein [Chitinophaga sp. SYP-B3965]|uniref:hypothetical protein n=1 Tax=Chitinophaga sp. SYP-B3965 TaxID=2663120 RepID=UPI001299EA79|nr:hypothetical protein [Chitinophaga sp. SYP-B3965]
MSRIGMYGACRAAKGGVFSFFGGRGAFSGRFWSALFFFSGKVFQEYSLGGLYFPFLGRVSGVFLFFFFWGGLPYFPFLGRCWSTLILPSF